ncbi:MAG: hypothetical protein VKM98_11015, partial [Cyanobacteriota bacterium]|nr:hypothetical protein [Cyanobacteriota bacterium]
FVLGSDLAAQIPSWRQPQVLLQRCRLAVVPRAGWPLQSTALQALVQLGARLEVLPLPVPASASSALRQRPDPGQIPSAVWALMQQHNLYGLAATASVPSHHAAQTRP